MYDKKTKIIEPTVSKKMLITKTLNFFSNTLILIFS